jgi:serine/threonine protein phosphatase PrpC
VRDKSGELLEPARHGLNRDAVRVALFGSVGVIAVADGCGLTYWSEIASHIAVNELLIIIEKRLASEHAPYSPTAMKTILKEAIHSVNHSMLSWKHPKTKSKFNVLDKGGNTTLVVAIVFPFSEDDTTHSNAPRRNSDAPPVNPPLASPTSLQSSPTDSKHTSKDKSPDITPESGHKTLSRKHSTLRPTDADRKYGVVFTGMGDSELYLFKVNEQEKPATKSKSSFSGQASSSSSSSIRSTDELNKRATSPGKPDSRQTIHFESTRSSSISGGSSRPSNVSPSSSFAAAMAETPESFPKSAKSTAKPLKEKKQSKSSLHASLPSHSSKHQMIHRNSEAPSPQSDISLDAKTPSEDDVMKIRPLAPSLATITIGEPIGTVEASSSMPDTRPNRSASGSEENLASTSRHQSDPRQARSGSLSGHSNHHSAITFSAPPATTGTTGLERPTRIPPRPAASSFSHSQRPGSPSLQSPTLAKTPSDATLLLSSHSRVNTDPTSNSEPDEIKWQQEVLQQIIIHPHDIKMPIEERADEEGSSQNSSTNSISRSLPAPPSLLVATPNPSKDSLLVVSSDNDRSAMRSSDSQALPAPMPSSAPIEGRSKRYSKSFSDLPSFESLLEENGLNRSESLNLNLQSAHMAKHAEEDMFGRSLSASSSTAATPRLPCGVWTKILTDSGKSPFIPFPGLKDRSIPEPMFLALNPGDAVFACSDGVVSSYADGCIQWPEIQTELYECKDGLDYAVNSLLASTMQYHKAGHTDPDDVTIGAIKVTSFAKKKKSDNLRVAPIRDHTATFAPQFASSQYADRDYLQEYLSEYPKPKEKNPS